MPVIGSSPHTAPMLITACPTIHAVMPAARSAPNRSAARAAARMPSTANPANEREHEHAAEQAELLGDDREDEVGVRVREEVPLGPAGAEPDAGPAAAADRDQRLRDLVALVRLVGERVQEREHPRPPVRRREREQGDHRGTHRTDAREVLRLHAADAMSTVTAIMREHERRAEVGLAHHEEPEADEDDQHRLDHPSPVGRPGGRAGWRDRRRRAGARAWRARSAGTGGSRHRSSAATPTRGCRCRGSAPPPAAPRSTIRSGRTSLRSVPVVDADADDERDHADDRPHQLAQEEVPGRSVVGERRHRRRREHHHDADDVEHADGEREQHRGRRPQRCRARVVRPAPAWARRRAAAARVVARGGVTAVIAHAPGSPPRARSRRLARRSSSTSRTTRTRATAARCRPAPRVLGRGAHRVVHRRGAHDGHRRPRTPPRSRGAASPIATTARRCEAYGRSASRSRELVAPTGDEHDRLQAVERARGGVRVRRLGVVDVVDAADGGHQLHPVRERRSTTASVAAMAASSAPTARAAAVAASALSTSWAARKLGSVDPHARRCPPRRRRSTWKSAGRIDGASSARPGRAPSAARRAATGSSALTTATCSATWWANTLPFAAAYASTEPCQSMWSRADVEQHRDVGGEGVGRELELERRHLGHDDVGVVVAPRRASGRPMLPTADARPAHRRSSMAAIIDVTVVLPFVPVTRHDARRRAARAGARPRGRPRRAPARRPRARRRAPGGRAARRGSAPRGRRAPSRVGELGRVGGLDARRRPAPAPVRDAGRRRRRRPGASSTTTTSSPVGGARGAPRRRRSPARPTTRTRISRSPRGCG